MKKSYSFRLNEKFALALTQRANIEQVSRTQLLERIGWDYLRCLYQNDELDLESFNKLFK